MLIVETGNGTNINANSYITIDEFDSYHSLYGQLSDVWLDADKEVALINASKSIDLLYGNRFKSFPTFYNQPLQFPRSCIVLNEVYIINANVIPKQLKDAVCEVALLHLSGSNIFPVQVENNIKRKTDSIGKGDIETSVEYFSPPVNPVLYENFEKVELLIKPLLKSSSTKRVRFSL